MLVILPSMPYFSSIIVVANVFKFTVVDVSILVGWLNDFDINVFRERVLPVKNCSIPEFRDFGFRVITFFLNTLRSSRVLPYLQMHLFIKKKGLWQIIQVDNDSFMNVC